MMRACAFGLNHVAASSDSFDARALSAHKPLANVNICASQCEESERRYPAFWRNHRVLTDSRSNL
jgi:hypothetical protein